MDKVPSSVSQNISQSLAPNEVDRFTFTIANNNDSGYPNGYVFLVTLKLVYNEDDKTLVSKNLLFFTRSASEVQASTQIGDYAMRVTMQNKKIVEEISQVEGIRSDKLNGLIDQFANIPDVDTEAS